MRRIRLHSVICLAVPYFSTESHKRHDFREKKLLNVNVCFHSLHIAYSKKNSAKYYRVMCVGIHVKYSYIELYANPCIGSRDIPCGWTDMTQLIVAFRNFRRAPKKCDPVCLNIMTI